MTSSVKAENVRAMVARQTTPGSLVLILMAGWAFLPRAWDALRGEPWLFSSAAVVVSSGGSILVSEETTTAAKVYGTQSIQVIDRVGDVLCSTERFGVWDGVSKTLWRFTAFAGCAAPSPNEGFKVCSTYSLVSDISGRHRQLGPFCTQQEPITSEIKS